MNKLVRLSKIEDVEFVSANMRREDIDECAAGGFTAYHALSFGFEHSNTCYTLLDPKTDYPGAMMGIVPTEDYRFGKIWLLGTPAIERNTTVFLRNSKPVMWQLLDESRYKAVYNYTYINNELHHRWLKWLGFVFLRKMELTPNNLFYEFVKLGG